MEDDVVMMAACDEPPVEGVEAAAVGEPDRADVAQAERRITAARDTARAAAAAFAKRTEFRLAMLLLHTAQFPIA